MDPTRKAENLANELDNNTEQESERKVFDLFYDKNELTSKSYSSLFFKESRGLFVFDLKGKGS